MKSNESQPTIVGIGEILWDILPGNQRLGGAPANFAQHTNSLGGHSAIISAIGDDKPGQQIFQHLNKSKVDTSQIRTNQFPTGWVDIELSHTGQPTYIIHENVAWDNIQTSPESFELAKKCDAVCFGSLAQRTANSRSAIQEFLTNTDENCLRIFDINLRQDYYSADIIYQSLQSANILKLNDEELAILQNIFNLPADTNSALASILNHYKLNLIALTMGAKGSIMMNQDTISFCPGIKTTVKDTIGAGDAFTAAMTMGVLSKLSLNKTNSIATKVAAFVCSHTGATPTLPDSITSELKYNMPIPIEEKANFYPRTNKTKH